jgi:hypothetical protein
MMERGEEWAYLVPLERHIAMTHGRRIGKVDKCGISTI